MARKPRLYFPGAVYHVSSLSSAVRRLQLKAKQDEKIADKYHKMMNRVRR